MISKVQLKTVLIEHRKTRKDLAKELGLSYSTLAAYLGGFNYAPIDFSTKLNKIIAQWKTLKEENQCSR